MHLIVVTAFLSYVGACEHQAQRELAALAAWMREGVGHGEALFADAVRQAAAVLEAPRILVVWIDPDHSLVSLALWANAKLTLGQEPPAALEWLVAEPLTDSDFICDDAAAADARVRCVSPTAFHWRGTPLHAKLQEQLPHSPRDERAATGDSSKAGSSSSTGGPPRRRTSHWRPSSRGRWRIGSSTTT